jgi:hypothetical protein
MMARFPWLLVASSWALACGGRYLEGPEAGAGGAAAASAAGKTSAGGAGQSNQGGARPVAGASAAGGATGTGGACCQPIGCPSGYETVPDSKGCGCHCEIQPETCQAQRTTHRTFSSQVFAKYGTIGCQTGADCTAYYENNVCASSCGTPLATAVVKEVDALLNQHAEMTCDAACPPIPIPPCPPTIVVCSNGRCE